MTRQAKQKGFQTIWVVTGTLALLVGAVILGMALSLRPNRTGVQPEFDSPSLDQTKPVYQGQISLVLPTAPANYAPGQELTVEAWLDTKGHNINLARVVLDYDTDYLELLEVETQDSVLTMRARDDSMDGQVNLLRGAPGDGDAQDNDDGFTGQGLFARFVFQTRQTGQTLVRLGRGTQMFLDDGRGTKMEVAVEGVEIEIIP